MSVNYSQYQDPQVRALVWCLLSPGLVNESKTYSFAQAAAQKTKDWCQQMYQSLTPFLQQLDKNPEPLHQWLAKYQSWRLGIRFEAYWSFIFKQLVEQQTLAKCVDHIQVQANIGFSSKPLKQTLGELDYVYQDKKELLTHLEIAVKFYLLNPDAFGFERLLGPNGGDWFERKLGHLFEQQLAISQTNEAQLLLSEHFDISHKETLQCQHQGLIKGMIFFPLADDGRFNAHETDLINKYCLTGFWGNINNWYLSDPLEIGCWLMIDKLAWLEPQIYSQKNEKMYSAKEMQYKLKAHFHNSVRSVLLAHLVYDEQSKLWQEQQRVMVVDKYWPSFKRNLDSMVKQSSQSNHPTNITTNITTNIPTKHSN